MILDLFQGYGNVKDIRMIKNKMTGQMKDFVFIEFYTPEDTTLAYNSATSPQFSIMGQKVSVMYSRNRTDDDYSRLMPYERKDRERRRGDRYTRRGDTPV